MNFQENLQNSFFPLHALGSLVDHEMLRIFKQSKICKRLLFSELKMNKKAYSY